MQKTPQDVHIPGERHLIIHGQFGNLVSRLRRLKEMLEDGEYKEFLPIVGELYTELAYLKDVYPPLDGEAFSIPHPRASASGVDVSERSHQQTKNVKVRNALRDMRVLMDAAYLSYVQGSGIDCHLNVMLNEAWERAAVQVDLKEIETTPF